MHNFRKLEVWKKAKDFSVEIYLLTKDFPKEEIYGITSQLRRAALSISNNISEGCGRGTSKQINHFLDIALGSAFEEENILIVAFEIKLTNREMYDNQIIKINEIQKMIFFQYLCLRG